jgi:hypothetical protein
MDRQQKGAREGASALVAVRAGVSAGLNAASERREAGRPAAVRVVAAERVDVGSRITSPLQATAPTM